MALSLLFGVKRKILHQKRSRAHDTHVALKDIPKFRKFIQGSGTQFFSELRQSLFLREKLSVRAFGVGHGTEFIQLEDLLFSCFLVDLTGSFLGENDRRSEVDPDHQGHDQKHGRKKDQGDPRKQDIQ